VDIEALDLTWLRRQIALVLQEPIIFSGTLAENIAYGRPGAGPAEIVAASRAAGLHEFVAGLPAGRWAYRSAAEGGRVYGMSAADLARLFASADVLVNVTGATVLRDEHRRVPVRVYLETDPVLPQIEVTRGRKLTTELLEAHTHHFTFGEHLGAPDCPVPVTRFAYRPTGGSGSPRWRTGGRPRRTSSGTAGSTGGASTNSSWP
jgi:hypothetical protein